jgi:CheY-like chemotaxis protein/HPt (histidine-containing phosphotransfer) domain-containing protein
LAEEIRKDPALRNVPLVLLTSLGQREDGERSRAINFAAYVAKPVKPAQLYDILVGVFRGQPIVNRPVAPSVQMDAELAQNHPLRILIAEDNLTNQKVILRVLERMGYRAELAATGLEVLQALDRQPYDLVLMDVRMPEMDGYEATRMICKRWGSSERPTIVAMTAQAMQGDREECMAAGMDDYISKPVRIDELVAVLKRVRPLGKKDQPETAALPSIGANANSTDGGGVIDYHVLNELQANMGESGPMIAELVLSGLQEATGLLGTMHTAFDQGDSNTLSRMAHTMKTSAAIMGAMRLATMCKDLELAVNDGRDGVPGRIDAIDQEFARASELLREESVRRAGS